MQSTPLCDGSARSKEALENGNGNHCDEVLDYTYTLVGDWRKTSSESIYSR